MRQFKRLANGEIYEDTGNPRKDRRILISCSIYNQYKVSDGLGYDEDALVIGAFAFLRNFIMEASVSDLKIINRS